jgi:hypothetical protein
MDAHERLSLVTVAAGLRRFAFLNHIRPRNRKRVSEILIDLGFCTRVFTLRFDIDAKTSAVSRATADAYLEYKKRNQRFIGLGVWSAGIDEPDYRTITVSNLGLMLSYPECCDEMDIQTKRRDHQLFLQAFSRDADGEPSRISESLRRKLYVAKTSESHLRRWHRRFELTAARFPFALHTACNNCLRSSSSPTAILSKNHERLSAAVSEELYFLVQWAANILKAGRS